MKLKIADPTTAKRQKMVASSGEFGQTKHGSGYAKTGTSPTPGFVTRNAQFAGTGANVVMTQPMFFSPLHTPQNWQIASKRRELYQWARFYYENEPKVAAGVDFYSYFPLNGFTLECKSKKILEFYEDWVQEIRLLERLEFISHDYHLLGEAFPFAEIDSPESRGETEPDPEAPHIGGIFRSLRVLNPDYIEVQDNVLAREPMITLLPDEELKMIVARRQPKHIFDNLPAQVKEAVATGRPIPLSNRCVSHIKLNAADYATYGTSMLRRLFTTLAYKTKLMTANWIVAERLILPIRVVKIGDKERPANQDDIQDVVNQLAAVANDPNLTVVTHHAFDYQWYGACFPEDDNIEILTENGWKNHQDIAQHEKLGTLNPASHKLEFENYSDKFEYDYDSDIYGGLYNFKSKRMNISVTPNHRMYTRKSLQHDYEIVESQNVKNHYKMLSQLDWDGSLPDVLPHTSVEKLSHLSLEEFLTLSGFYLSEGHLQIDKYKGLKEDKQIRALGITQKTDSSCYDIIEQIVAKTYPSYSTHKDSRGCVDINTLVINSVDIARFIDQQFGHGIGDKRIPEWILSLPKKYLQVIFDAMMLGDGNVVETTKGKKYKYTSKSKQLANNVFDIVMKLGSSPKLSFEKGDSTKSRGSCYRVFWTDSKTVNEHQIGRIERTPYKGKVWCYSVPNGLLVARFHGRMFIIGNSGKIHNITNELEYIGKEILDGLMLNQALLNGEMGSYNGAAVGVEVLLRRLEGWRNKLKLWVEERVFKPIAQMQGFIDEDKSKRHGKTVYLYPKLKWNELNLRDKTQKAQLYTQWYDKQLLSARTLLEFMDLDYDTEVERIREEQLIASAGGQIMGQGGPGSAMGMMGGMGGGLGGGGGGGGPGGPGGPMGGMGGMAGGAGGMAGGAGGMAAGIGGGAG
ncbi:MAG: hypothetical protein HC888_01665, partial [Candidatus Competibacteraceae bacterium]|nr:hypothetical protein [Candidatus Competibacteraceae bacterium]